MLTMRRCRAPRSGRADNMIALFTDFGLHGPYTGQMKAHRALDASLRVQNDVPSKKQTSCCGKDTSVSRRCRCVAEST
jgi:hypothetical protein